MTTGIQKTHFFFLYFLPGTCFPCLDLTKSYTRMRFPLPAPTWKIPQGVWLPGAMVTPTLAADWIRRSHPFVPFGPSPSPSPWGWFLCWGCKSNPTVREGRRGSHLLLFWIHFNALMPWNFFFKKKYIYIFGFGGEGNFFSLWF